MIRLDAIGMHRESVDQGRTTQIVDQPCGIIAFANTRRRPPQQSVMKYADRPL
jgi:hypothetical protein